LLYTKIAASSTDPFKLAGCRWGYCSNCDCVMLSHAVMCVSHAVMCVHVEGFLCRSE